MGWWDDFTSNGYDQASQGYQKGADAVNDAYNQAVGYMKPFWQGGMNELGMYQNGVNAMANPNAFANSIMSQYQMSPQAQFQLSQGHNGMNAAAAAGGTLGSSGAMKDMDQFNQQVTNTDMNNFLDQRMGIYNNFLNNAGNLTGMGMNAAGQIGGWGMDKAADLAQLYGQQGMANMYGQQANNNFWGNVIGGAASHFF